MTESEIQTAPADYATLDKLAGLALTPVTIRGVFLLLTRIHWSNAEHYGTRREKLAPFVWDKDPTKSGLLVDYDYNFDPERKEQRPAIYVGTDNFTFSRMVVDNRRGQTLDNAGEDYVKIADTNIIIRHIGKTPDESLQMGDMTTQFFLGMRKLLQERMKVHSFEVTQLMASRPFEQDKQQSNQQFIVDLIMNLKYNAVWLILREGHRLKTITYEQCLADYIVPTSEPETKS